MPRFTFALALLLTVPAAAQEFPAPGTGVYTWDRVGDRPLDARALSFAPGGRLVAANDSVWTFIPDPSGPPAGRWSRALNRPRGRVEALLALDAGADTLLLGNGGATQRSVDGGATWALVNGSFSGTESGGPQDPDAFHVVPPGHTHAGRLLAGGVVLFSDDRGATWPDAAQDIPFNQQATARTFAVLPSGRVLAGTGGGVLASGDGGEGYLRTPLYGPYAVNALAPLATPGSRQAGAASCGLADVSFCDGAVAVGSSPILAGAQAWRTADGGRTWSEPVALPEPDDGIGNGRTAGVVGLAVGPDGLGRAVAVLGRGVVYATRDGGRTWGAVGRMPVATVAHNVLYAKLGPDGHLWVATVNAGNTREWVYRSAEPAEAAFAVAAEPSPGESSEVGVSVRPNPSGGRVEVAVSLASSGPVRAVVLDALGREVAVVLDAVAGPGERVAGVDTSGWPAGVYVVRATAGAGVASARLVVAR